MITLTNCVRYSECLPNGKRYRHSCYISPKSVFVSVIFFQCKHDNVSMKIFCIGYFPFHLFKLHFFHMYEYLLLKNPLNILGRYSGIFHSLQSVKILLLCNAKGSVFRPLCCNVQCSTHKPQRQRKEITIRNI